MMHFHQQVQKFVTKIDNVRIYQKYKKYSKRKNGPLEVKVFTAHISLYSPTLTNYKNIT